MKITTKEIIEKLGLAEKTTLAKNYASKLSGLFALINELEKLDGFKVSLKEIRGNVEIVKDLPDLNKLDLRWDERRERREKQCDFKILTGLFTQWQTIEVSHLKGSIFFPFPIGNEIYNVLAGMAGQKVELVKDEIDPILQTILVDAKVFKNFEKAAKFVSKDALRPAMQCVCLSIEKLKCRAVGTDAHIMYYSPYFECSEQNKVDILLSAKDAKELAKIKPESDLIEINIIKDNRISINGKIYNNLDARYPDFNRIIPDYSQSMQFDKTRFIDNVKKVMPFANKFTKQVNLHLNGTIAFNSYDIDFALECSSEMPYISKGFKDTDISFSGKYLVDALGVFKDKTVMMQSEEQSKRAAIFTNGIDNVLLMPLLIND